MGWLQEPVLLIHTTDSSRWLWEHRDLTALEYTPNLVRNELHFQIVCVPHPLFFQSVIQPIKSAILQQYQTISFGFLGMLSQEITMTCEAFSKARIHLFCICLSNLQEQVPKGQVDIYIIAETSKGTSL